MRVEGINADEAINLYHCMKQIDKETQFMLYLPEERSFETLKLYEDIQQNYYVGVKKMMVRLWVIYQYI